MRYVKKKKTKNLYKKYKMLLPKKKRNPFETTAYYSIDGFVFVFFLFREVVIISASTNLCEFKKRVVVGSVWRGKYVCKSMFFRGKFSLTPLLGRADLTRLEG